MQLSKLLLSFFFLLLFFTISFTQDQMAPPKPVENKVYDAMCGKWEGESEMMGMKMKQNLNIYWALDHQYIFMELKSTGIDKPEIQYSGLGIFGVDKDGNAKTWWFDNWGAESMASGSGTFGENKVTMTSSNPMYKDTRTFEIKGSEMIMNAASTMNMGGQEMTMNESTTYKKK